MSEHNESEDEIQNNSDEDEENQPIDQDDDDDNEEQEQENEAQDDDNEENINDENENEEEEEEVAIIQTKGEANPQIEHEANNNDNNNTNTNANNNPNEEQQVVEIKDPTVLKLLNMDLETADKNEIFQLLMENNILAEHPETITLSTSDKHKSKQNESLSSSYIEKQNQLELEKIKKQNPYKHTSSKLYQYISGNSIDTGVQSHDKYKKSDKYHIFKESKNPEFIPDFTTATNHVLSKMSNDPNNEKIMKLLLTIPEPSFNNNSNSNNNYNNNHHASKKTLTRDEITSKINQALSKKQEAIEKIINRCNEEYNNKHTFTPVTNQKNETKRNLQQFLNDQHQHLEKVKRKVEDCKIKENEKIKGDKFDKPSINKNSEMICQKVIKKEEPVHVRLYNKQYQTAKNSLLQEKEKKTKEKEDKEREESKKRKERARKKMLETINNNNNGDKKESVEKVNKVEQYKNRFNQKEVYLMKPKDIPTNKILLNAFNMKFNKVLNEFSSGNDDNDNNNNNVGGTIKEEDEQQQQQEQEQEQEEQKEEEEEHVDNEDENDVKENEIENEPQQQQEQQQQQQQEQNEPNATTPQNNNNNETPQTQITEITNEQLPLFLHKMGMCSKPNNDSENSPINKSSIQQRENTLITDISNSLKNPNDKIPIQNLRKFLLCVVGLHYYTLYEEFKSTHTNKEIEDLLSKSNANTAQTSQDKLQFFILTQDTTNSALINQSNDQNNKYISYSSKDESSIIIPITKAKKIKKDFDLFAITYISSRSTKASTNPSSSSSTNNTDKPLFYPHIDKNSKKMSQKSRDKVMENTNAPNQPYSHMDYIDRIIMARKKKLAENQRIKEENDKKLLLECTFKPKMQNKSTIKKTTGANRFKELFIKGTEKVKSRKNRTQDDFENEKNKKECTFKPDINHDNLIIPETRFTNDIYGDKSYQIFYERMKNGKTERQIKEAALNRFGMDDTLKEYLKQKKQKEYALHSGGGDDNEMQSDNDNQNGNGEQGDESGNNNQNESDNKEEDEANDESGNDNQQSDEGGDGELDKKEGIPLLIIDVNIRQGVKKKIYVFEGDTPEGLAEKFSKEHNLEPQTKEKLQNLINNHMLRLLTRIDEENQSLSEKSGTTHMQKNQS